ncbi:MAG: hypothetical protein JST09_17620, partial [Bacteroidetes bacterium]|nr:hypothetical protein [Bacteroidota bacterium]
MRNLFYPFLSFKVVKTKRTGMYTFIGCYFLLLSLLFVQARAQKINDVSGAYYDWRKTMKPERPWLRDYSQTLVMKMFLCSRDSTGNVKQVYLRFEDALEEIKKLDRITLGIPKIIYLVGWQFTGHDSGYPSWSEVNASLKRNQDRSAVESLHWLIREAKQYHTIVSLHINMIDAFKNSPLWNVYDANDIIIKDKSGQPIPGEVFDGMQSYQISYAQEWKKGYAQKRIDSLLRLLPELKEGATIHIDAFHSIQPVRKDDPISSPYLGYSINDEIAAQRKIFRYWRLKGLDVTSEGSIYWLRKDPFIGLQPMAWHFDNESFLSSNWIGKTADFKELPPQLYCGTPMHGEQEIKEDPKNLTGLIGQFCTKVVPWYYHNNLTKKKYDAYRQVAGDIFLPVLWLKNTLVAFSEKGYDSKKWKLPPGWHTSKVIVSIISV